VSIKSAIISRDETEKGERRILNFGHTFGHAIEMTAGIPHGRAVAMGMTLAANLSFNRGLLTSKEYKRLQLLLNDLSLPARFDARAEDVLAAIGKDKKREGDRIHFVLLNGIGNAVVEQLTLDELKEALDA
jgi:3-dehydroquinate synthase